MKHRSSCFEEIMYYEFADNELGVETASRVKAHLDSCPACRSFVEEIKAENSAIKEIFAAESDTPDLTRTVINRLNKKRFIHISGRRLAYAATFFLTVFLFIFFFLYRTVKIPPGGHQVLVHSARVEGRAAQPHIFESGDPRVKFIWLEKSGEEKREMEANNEKII
jgi:hypothetical protein